MAFLLVKWIFSSLYLPALLFPAPLTPFRPPDLIPAQQIKAFNRGRPLP
jgi:hypothetical protein